jgi:hypothetical protein
MQRFILVFILAGSMALSSHAQRPVDPYAEIGLTVGYSYYIGDINPYTHLGQRKKLAYGGMYRYNLTQRHALRFQLMRMELEAYDSDNTEADLVNRNLNFRTDLTEASVILEINFHDYRLGRIGKGFTPYIFGGLAYYNFNPETELDGNYFELIPLGTEGQGSATGPKAYKKGQMAIPIGLGVKAGFSDRLALNIEWGIRRTFTDYLDDVSGFYADPDIIRDQSGDLGRTLADRTIVPIGPGGVNTGMQRGDPETRDYYIYTGLILTVRLGKDSNGCWR